MSIGEDPRFYYYPVPTINPDPWYQQPWQSYNPYPPILPQYSGCICPGDATQHCQNPFCPRKNPFDKLTTTC